MKIRTQGARAADTDVQTYSRQIDELEKKLAVDQAAQSSLVAESLKGQTEQSAAFTQQRIENAISANATMGAIGRKQAELSIQLNELVARSEIDKYTSNEARAVAGAALEVQVARQKLDQIGALEAAESQKRIQLLREKSAAIPSTADDTSGGRERLAIAGQIAQVQGESDHKQIELRGALYAAQEKYKASVITAEREISALVIAGFDRLDDEWKQAQQRVKEYTEARAKAETKASETESAGAGKAASLKIQGQKLALERAYGQQVSHTGAQQVAYMSQVAALEEKARQEVIGGKRNELATAEGSDDPAQIEKAAKIRADINKLQAESDHTTFEAQTKILDVILAQNNSLQATKEIAGALTEWGQINLGSLRKDLADGALKLPEELAGSLADSIFDRPRRGQSKAQEVGDGLVKTGESIGKQLFTQLLTQAIERLIAQLIPQAAIASIQASAQTANTTALGALTAAVVANTTAQGVSGAGAAAGGVGSAAGAAGSAAGGLAAGLAGPLIAAAGGVIGGVISGVMSLIGSHEIVTAIHGTTAAVEALGAYQTALPGANNGAAVPASSSTGTPAASGVGIMSLLGSFFGNLGFGTRSPLPVSVVSFSPIAPIAGFARLLGFADGGRPAVGQPAIFGHGPELWIPDTPGTVIPANTTRSVMASMRIRPRGVPMPHLDFATPNGFASSGFSSSQSNNSSYHGGNPTIHIHAADDPMETARNVADVLRSTRYGFGPASSN